VGVIFAFSKETEQIAIRAVNKFCNQWTQDLCETPNIGICLPIVLRLRRNLECYRRQLCLCGKRLLAEINIIIIIIIIVNTLHKSDNKDDDNDDDDDDNNNNSKMGWSNAIPPRKVIVPCWLPKHNLDILLIWTIVKSYKNAIFASYVSVFHC